MPDTARAGVSLDRRLKRTIGLLTSGVLVVLAGLRGADLWWRREQTLKVGERRAANLALILSAHLRGAFEAADASLRQLAIHGQRVGGSGAPPEQWMPILNSAWAGLAGIGSLSVVDAAGVIRHSTQARIIGQSRRDYYVFQSLAAEPRDRLVADTPFLTISSRQFVIPLARRLVKPDGTFDGILVATFVPKELRAFFQTVDVGATGTIWVLHPDGSVLFREPSVENPMGETAAGNPIFEAAQGAAGAGTLRGPIGPQGPVLLSAYTRLPDPPLILAISLGEAEVLADWWREVVVSAAVLLFFAFAVATVLRLLFRQIDARATAEQALSRARRLESIGHLTGGVAHDFNNLLTVILGNAYRLRHSPAGALPGPAVHAVEQIEKAADRAADLTRRLLAFARRQPLQPRVVDLNELVQGLKPMLTQLLGEDVAVRVELDPSPCLAVVDPVQVETAVMNLCVNARDAMPQGGQLVIRTGRVVLDEGDARENTDATPGPYAVVSVTDTGVGIAPENMARLFEPFFTTKGPGQGTGLGLSMVYGFVRQSDGHVKVDSQLGRGTVVTLCFPAANGRSVSPPSSGEAAAARGAGETILLVEDEDGVRDLAAETLSALGYRVLAAADGPTALARARREPRIDLLFTDVLLPKGVNGRQLADELRRERPDLRVLYASGYSEDIVEHRGQLDPGLGFLPKPYASDQLAQAVRAALQGVSSPRTGRESARP